MMDMDKCPECNEWWVTCPCCQKSFCPSCQMLEEEAYLDVDEEDVFAEDDEE